MTRTENIGSLIQQIQSERPYLRVGQIISIAVPNIQTFHVSDAMLYEGLQELLEGIKESNNKGVH